MIPERPIRLSQRENESPPEQAPAWEQSGAVALAGLVLFLLAFYGVHLLRIPVGTDNTLIYAPFFSLRWDGGPPWWNPFFAGGSPTMDNLQAAMLYPLRWPFFFLNDWTAYYGPHGFLHYAVAAGGTLLWLRGIGFRNGAALAGMVAFAGGGYLAGRVINPTIFYATCWLPLMLYAASGIGRRHNWALTVAFFMILATGSPHLTLYGPLGFAIVYTARSLGAWNRRDMAQKIVHGALGFLLAAPAFIGGVLRVPGTLRTESTVEANLSDSVAYREFLPMLLGGTGNTTYPEYVDKAFYLGAPVLILMVAAACRRSIWSDWRWRAGVALVAVGFLFALGRNAGLHFVMPYIPGFNKLQGPGRALAMSAGGVALLAACAIDRWHQLDRRLLLGATAAVLVVAFVLMLRRAGGHATIWVAAWLADPRAVAPGLYGALDSVIWCAVMLVVVALARQLGRWGAPAFVLLLVALPAWHFRPRVFLEMWPRDRFAAPESAMALQLAAAARSPEPFRIASFDPIRVYARDFTEAHVFDFLEPNLSTLYGLESIEGFDPLIHLNYRDMMVRLAGRAPYDDPIRTLHPGRPSEDLYRQLNVEYLIGHPLDRAIHGAGFQLFPETRERVDLVPPGDAATDPVSEWQFVSLIDAPYGPFDPMQPVAELIVEGSHGRWEFPIRVGRESDMLYRLDPETPVRQQATPVPVHARWFHHAPRGDGAGWRVSTSNYRGRVVFPEPTVIERVEWRLRQRVVFVAATQGYRLAEDDAFAARWDKLHHDPRGVTPVYRFRDSRPRATVLSADVDVAPDSDGRIQLSDAALVAPPPPETRALYTAYRNSLHRIDVQSPAPGHLLLRQPAAFATRVRIDNQPARALSANGGLFTLIPIPEGKSVVEIRHHPPLWLLGVGILGLLLALVKAGVDVRGRRESREEG